MTDPSGTVSRDTRVARIPRPCINVLRLLTGIIIGLAWSLSAESITGAEAPRTTSRNVVLFVTDDFGPDAGCYGNPVVKTPHLDALAEEGLRFDRAFCTTASCSASRSVILTGLYNHANAQYGHQHAYHHFRTFQSVKSLPMQLAQAGYRTARVGKFHVGPEEVYPFETVLPGSARNAVQKAENCRPFLEAADDRPFFLYFCTEDPHRSGGHVEGDPHHANPFGNRPQGYPGVAEQVYRPEDVVVPPFLPDTPVCRAELAQYYQSVSRIDQGLGHLIQILREQNLYENTLIIFTSDHGIAFPGAKTTVYEPGMKIPLVIRHPDRARKSDDSTKDSAPTDAATQAMVSLVDFAPTILDFAGVLREDHELHGHSFLPVLIGEEASDWNEVYASHTFHEITMYYPMRVVHTGRFKLIWNIAHQLPYPFASDLWEAPTWQDIFRQGLEARYGQRTVEAYIHRPRFELYDLEDDPHEIHNLADAPDHRERLAELQGKLKRFQERTGDPWLLKWDYE